VNIVPLSFVKMIIASLISIVFFGCASPHQRNYNADYVFNKRIKAVRSANLKVENSNNGTTVYSRVHAHVNYIEYDSKITIDRNCNNSFVKINEYKNYYEKESVEIKVLKNSLLFEETTPKKASGWKEEILDKNKLVLVDFIDSTFYPSTIDAFGKDAYLPQISKIKIDKFEIFARIPEMLTGYDIMEWALERKASVCSGGGLMPGGDTNLNTLVQRKIGGDWQPVSTLYIADLNSAGDINRADNYRVVEFVAVDGLNDIPISSALIELRFSPSDVYNIEDYSSGFINKLTSKQLRDYYTSVIPDDLKIKQNSSVAGQRPIVRLKNKKMKASIVVRHQDYIAYKGTLSLNGNEENIRVRMERIGALQRDSSNQPRSVIEAY